MTREYPDEPAGEFPSPPDTVTDGEGREIRYRSGGDDDPEALVEMYLDFEAEDRAQGIPPVREEPIRDWLDVLLSDDCLNVVACHDGAPVGHATLVPDEGESYELAIFVVRPYQGAGIGTELLEHLLGYAQEEGVEQVWLTVERWNDPAIAVYKKVGFEMTSTESFELEMAIRLE
ncbi:GNAT family N-acetyltransferase [Halorientalis pallida]|uniref:GNAT family N-acetyltransferase n=1 Tax=Halorientalis pallida TaxID=2479928 RepID=A0A498KY73_9EURY|nr:GNAT family N-acetyltransferase [Halorientalis pallida]RXK47270.1 GNAT family N-acetyltransferase [Halorientalis pallida]